MGRLIDADAFIEYVNRRYDLCSDELRMMIEEQPTAYDISKVVAELEGLKNNLGFGGTLQTMYADAKISDAIDIVRKGGVE